MNSEKNQSNDVTTDQTYGRRRFIKQASLLAVGTQFNAFLPLPAWSRNTKSVGKSVVAETARGKVRGAEVEGIKVFKAIPYGGNTTGRNRFMPPAKPVPWTGVRDTLDYGPSTPQRDPNDPDAGARAASAALIGNLSGRPESEDCLVLNVWTPARTDGGKRPVMFWCHGGGFSTGSGSSAGYDGTNLCKRGDVVVATINHRLNVLGYTHLGDLSGEEFAQSGNVGMLDIVHALKWVRENIAQFGGDPNTETPVLGGKLRSPHGLEIGFVFDNASATARYNGGGPEAVALAGKLSEAWIAFTRTGNPNTPQSGLPKWPAYDVRNRATMLFNNQSAIANDYGREERLVLEEAMNRA